MGGYEASIGHRFNAILRFYVSRMPEASEAAWQRYEQFEHLTPEQRQPGHWFRSPDGDVIETRADGSGQWHADGVVPANVDPKMVVLLPAGVVYPTLMDKMAAIIGEIPKDAPGYPQIAAILQGLRQLSAPDRPKMMATSFQKALAAVPMDAEKQLRFLKGASQQMVQEDLLAGKATGDEVSYVLMIAALAETIGAANPGFSALMKTLASWNVTGLDELASRFIDGCWQFGMKDKVIASLDLMRSNGEATIQVARTGPYKDIAAERVPDIYYGVLLQSVPHLLGANNGYFMVSHSPGLSADDLELYSRRANTSEEKLVRVVTALKYAMGDVDLSRLREKQGMVAAALGDGNTDAAKAIVNGALNLEFLYPPIFLPVLLGKYAADPKIVAAVYEDPDG